MSERDVIERAVAAYAKAVAKHVDDCAARGLAINRDVAMRLGMQAATRVLLDWLGIFHGIPASELAQARRELGIDAEPGRLVDKRV